MTRKRRVFNFDPIKTTELGQPGLQVIAEANDDEHVNAAIVSEPEECPECHGNSFVIKETRKRTFNDALQTSPGKYKFIELKVFTYKYICKNPQCNHVFSSKIDFAPPHSLDTYRYTDAVIKASMNSSFGKIAVALPGTKSPQAVGTLFRTWYDRMESIRAAYRQVNYTPSFFGIISIHSQKQSFTAFLDCDAEDLFILDVIPEVGTMEIAQRLAEYDDEEINCFVINCEQSVKEFLDAYYPGKEVITPASFLMDMAMEDYVDTVSADTKDIFPKDKQMLYDSVLGKGTETDQERVGFILRTHSRTNDSYDDITKLRFLLDGDWEYMDLFRWSTQITNESDFPRAIDSVSVFRKEIIAAKKYETDLPPHFYDRVSRFIQCSSKFEEKTPEVLRARILYVDMKKENGHNDIDYTDPTIDSVSDSLELLLQGKGTRFDRRRNYANK